MPWGGRGRGRAGPGASGRTTSPTVCDPPLAGGRHPASHMSLGFFAPDATTLRSRRYIQRRLAIPGPAEEEVEMTMSRLHAATWIGLPVAALLIGGAGLTLSSATGHRSATTLDSAGRSASSTPAPVPSSPPCPKPVPRSTSTPAPVPAGSTGMPAPAPAGSKPKPVTSGSAVGPSPFPPVHRAAPPLPPRRARSGPLRRQCPCRVATPGCRRRSRAAPRQLPSRVRNARDRVPISRANRRPGLGERGQVPRLRPGRPGRPPRPGRREKSRKSFARVFVWGPGFVVARR